MTGKPGESPHAHIGNALAIKDRLTRVIRESGEFGVEASEIDGLGDVRLTISDKKTGRWLTLTAETGPEDRTEGEQS